MSIKVSLSRGNVKRTEIVEALRFDGYVMCALTDVSDYDLDVAQDLMDQVLESVATPIQIFAQYPRWRPIGVDLARDPSRSQGIGVSPLHMDFVNAENPPDLIMLYCERSDPAGGGNTTLAPTSAAESLPLHFRRRLRDRCYADGRVDNLANVGEDINPFAVISQGQTWQVRYTDQLLHSTLDDDANSALRALHEALQSQVIALPLHAAEAIIVDQHRMLHGRQALGDGQAQIPADNRRLIWQRFGRSSLAYRAATGNICATVPLWKRIKAYRAR
jgi:hypothetical protein